MTESSSAISRRRSAFVIGIDGGGTHTRARLANMRGETLGSGEAGTSNPHAAGFDAAQNEILSAVRHAFTAANIEMQIVDTAAFGIGGVDRVEERTQFQTWAEQHIAQHVAVMNDGEIVLAAGSPENWGVALIAGTGSIAWGKSRGASPRIFRAGGWGYLIGDEGSGFALAQGAIRAAVQFADGRGESTHLLKAILDYWNLETPQQLIPRVYRSGLKPADLAKLAPLVVRVAQEGDAIAKRLLEESAEALATTIIAVARALNMHDEKIPLALTGGLLIETESLHARLLEIARARGYDFSPTLVHDPVVGAVRIALRLAQM